LSCPNLSSIPVYLGSSVDGGRDALGTENVGGSGGGANSCADTKYEDDVFVTAGDS